MIATTVSMENLLFLREDSFASMYVDELFVADSFVHDYSVAPSEYITTIHPILQKKVKTLESNMYNHLQPDTSRKRLNTEEEAIFMDMVLRTFEDDVGSVTNVGPSFAGEDLGEMSKLTLAAKPESETLPEFKRATKSLSSAKAKKVTAPAFIATEMSNTTGQGSFSTIELLTLLFFAQENILKPNSYSKIRRLMGGKRSRASIRRKIEKIVAREVGVTGGLLQKQELRQKTLDIVKDRFRKLLNDSENSSAASPKTRQFARHLREYATENSTIS